MLTTLYAFQSQGDGCATSGGLPVAGLVQATDGNFYGTTLVGGTFCGVGCGTIFKIAPDGAFSSLYSFCESCIGGQSPYAGLIQDTDGDFCGTTAVGGISDYGTLFSLSVGLGPFVKAQTNYGKVGAAVEILGTDLTGATSVSFSGTLAPFKVISSSLIDTSVPAGGD